MCHCQGAGKVGGRTDWNFEISRCKLVYIEWINNKILLYNTRNYIQYSVIEVTVEKKRKNTHMYN